MPAVPARVSFVTIGAHDLAALRAFYAGLGWREAISTDGFAALETGGAILGLFPIEELIADTKLDVSTERPAFRGVTLAINVESADRVDETLDNARDAGATILKEGTTAEWGGRSGYFADPEGNVWEVAWMPGSWFDPGGGLVLPDPTADQG